MSNRQIHLQAPGGLWPVTWPMGLTMLRMLLLPVYLWSLLAHAHGSADPRPWVPILIFAVMAVTDKLDGYLARRLNQTTRLGALLDPVADKLLVGCSIILLSFEWVAGRTWTIPLWVIIAVYGKDIITAAGAVALLAIAGRVTIAARPLGKLSTVLQCAMVLAVLLVPYPDSWRVGFWRALVVGLWWGVSLLALASCVDYVLEGVRQLRESRRPSEAEAREDSQQMPGVSVRPADRQP